MPFELGGPSYGVRDGLIGTWAGDGTYTDEVDIFGIRVLGIQQETTSADLDGDDTTLATQTTIKKGTVTLAFASMQFAIIEKLTGIATLDGMNYTRQIVSSKNPPYNGLSGKAIAAEGGGDMHVFIPKAKMTGGFQVRMELDTFLIEEVTLSAVMDDNFEDADGFPVLWVMDQHSTVTSIALPPVGLPVVA